ncbi:hypothetical protein D3C85_1208490 [compost metagenome]
MLQRRQREQLVLRIEQRLALHQIRSTIDQPLVCTPLPGYRAYVHGLARNFLVLRRLKGIAWYECAHVAQHERLRSGSGDAPLSVHDQRNVLPRQVVSHVRRVESHGDEAQRRIVLIIDAACDKIGWDLEQAGDAKRVAIAIAQRVHEVGPA